MTRNFVTPDVMMGVTYSAGIGLSAVTSKMERVMGIEPTLSAWEAEVLPLNYTRVANMAKGITDLRRRIGPLTYPAGFLKVASWNVR